MRLRVHCLADAAQEVDRDWHHLGVLLVFNQLDDAAANDHGVGHLANRLGGGGVANAKAHTHGDRHMLADAGQHLLHGRGVQRAEYVGITDDEALAAFHHLCRAEGIIPALESSHAVAYALKLAKTMRPDQSILVNLSGRGDKDIGTVADLSGEDFYDRPSMRGLSVKGAEAKP